MQKEDVVETAKSISGKVKGFDISVIPHLLKFTHNHYWVDYDEDTDTLYISFRKPQCANDSIMENNLVYHYDGEEMVGITIINARYICE